MTKGYGGCTRREIREMHRAGNAILEGIREERRYRRRLGVEENRWDREDWDRWDRRVNWALMWTAIIFTTVMSAIVWWL